jgi:cytoskeletal protein CcmA (bactofilin family)
VIGKSAVIVGNLVSQDQVQLNGHVVGNIDVNGSPHAQLSVMPQGHVEGDINARQALVNGVVNGNIASDGRVELHSGADVKGNISYATMAIEHGAKLYGIMTSKDAE